ncbi:MAG TPA: GNAT family N-acetyltransferase [Pyrinomonadaceae bacterium]|nr:GNAT family N-acetyltransferase [Pyrinomonadaceae bacterium]
MTQTGGGGPIRLADGREVTLRPVSEGDDELLLAIYASTREEELAQVAWGEGQKEAFLRMQFEAQSREYRARFPDAEYDVILLEGRAVGRWWVGRAEDEIRLLDIALLPDAQNRGVGGALLKLLIEEARAAGVPLRHMVFVMNEGARRFYERLGFRVFEEVGAYLHMEWRPEGAAAEGQAK